MEDIETILSDFSQSTGVNTIVVASRSGIPITTFAPDDSEDLKEALSAAASGIVHISEYVSDLLKFKGVRDDRRNIRHKSRNDQSVQRRRTAHTMYCG